VNDVGQPGKRCEDQRRVTGHGAFMDDRTCPGRLHAPVLRSPSAYAHLRSVDGSAARTRPGVVAVPTRAGITGVLPEISARAMVGERAVDERCAPEQLLMATDNGWDVGHVVAMVVAHCLLSLGQLYATIGCRAEARTALATAIALSRTMEMTCRRPEAEAALAQVEGWR
jgi:CO/xanthine dehydrogenase Mo-binding subunit